ncbi:MGMT family protein [Bacillaceae bacterium SIJ1]|uniref:MGMT family protein n=1 Tax=Litoribacterium kuwaitense TaxID=1398745 RepID=UPI0013EB3DF7|nr:MGMT family protein [Litoribacterium kuwaitense]NGP44630.1 MGMT family protein [Litoribacterium kuwaitense]
MTPFTAKVINIIKQIPEGYVMSYGQIAKAAGSPRGARQVVRILHSMSQKHRLPWHRVVNIKGEIAIKDDEGQYTQRVLLEEEGVTFTNKGCVDLQSHRFDI